MREAERLTDIAAADFSRLRRVKLERFTIDRLMTILDRLGQEVEPSMKVWPRPQDGRPASTAGHP